MSLFYFLLILLSDPEDRPSAEEALELPLFQPYHSPELEPNCGPIDVSFDVMRTLEQWREMLFNEIADFHAQHPI